MKNFTVTVCTATTKHKFDQSGVSSWDVAEHNYSRFGVCSLTVIEVTK